MVLHRLSITSLMVVLLAAGWPAQAAVFAVSGKQAGEPAALTTVLANGVPTQVAVSLDNGLPLWYQDGSGRKLTQCLDVTAEIPGVGTVDPCELLLANPQHPPSLDNVGEVLYWQAEAAFNYISRQGDTDIPGFALLVLALQGGGADIEEGVPGVFAEGNQAVFSRIRLRIDVPVAGTYRVTHPFGTFDYVIPLGGVRSINQTQDVGIAAAQNFLAAMQDRNIVQGPLLNPDVNSQVVNSDGATIGSFLQPTLAFSPVDITGGPVTASNGNRYIGLPFDLNQLPIVQAVAGENGAESFRIELINPPDGFELNPGAADPQVLETNEFLVVGKIFNDGANQAPVAPPATIGILKGRTVADIDVFAGRNINDYDPLSLDLINGNNVHTINPQAIALADSVSGVYSRDATGMPLLTAPRSLPSGARVERFTRAATGQSLFRYTVPTAAAAGFSDTFHYVVQDTGGLISAPAEVKVLVEDLQIDSADYRVKTGKWHIRGTTDQREGNLISLYAAPRARLNGANITPPVATNLVGTVDTFVSPEVIDYRLIVKGLPLQDNNLEVSLHVDGPGQPEMFRLCSTPNRFISPFPPACSITDGVLDLSAFVIDYDLLPGAAGAGVLNFSDAVDALLAGKAYVNVRTTTNPGGAIRGTLNSSRIGVATVNAEGGWEFRGKARFLPGFLPNVTARSSLGTQTYGTPLRLR